MVPCEVVSERVRWLEQQARGAVLSSGLRTVFSLDEYRDVERLRIAAYREHADEPVVIRRALAFERIVQRHALSIEPRAFFAGSQRNSIAGAWCDDPEFREIAEERAALGIHFADGHMIAGYADVIRHGFEEIAERVRTRIRSGTDSDQRRSLNLRAMQICMEAASRVGTRYAAVAAHAARKAPDDAAKREWTALAERCVRVPAKPARTFAEALQSLWFVNVLLHWEDQSTAVSVGRFDQYLRPYLEADLERGALTQDGAQELVDALWIKFLEGNESQNVTLGGCDRDGRDASNGVTWLALRASARLRTWQPSISVRLSGDPPEALMRECADLVRARTSMPGFFSDSAVIAGLVRCGLSLEDARDYGIVGCYEATGCGNHYGRTVAGWLNAPRLLREHLAASPGAASFDEFYRGYLERVRDGVRDGARRCNEGDERLAAQAPSPFRSALFLDAIERGLTLEQGGARYNTTGYSLGGLVTAADSLLAIRRLVFEERRLGLGQLAGLLDRDFAGDEALREDMRSSGRRFGVDDADADAIAVELADVFAREVLAQRNRRGGCFMPGLYQFKSQTAGRAEAGATPDGRRLSEPLSYGVGPSHLARGRSVTAMLNSAARLPHALCANGNTLELNLLPDDLRGEEGTLRIAQLVRTYFEKGGSQLTINVVSSEDLLRARQRPQESPDLMVRVSGFSARFVALDRETQDDVIQRVQADS